MAEEEVGGGAGAGEELVKPQPLTADLVLVLRVAMLAQQLRHSTSLWQQPTARQP